MLARDIGVDASRINYVPFRGGGEAVAAILGNNVSVGGSGYSEFQQYIESGKMRAIAVTSPTRLKGIDLPTMKEQGFNVEIGNWRGVYGAPGITTAQRDALVDRVVSLLPQPAARGAAGLRAVEFAATAGPGPGE
jgi:putative tricarboxylic transport membrane protein